MAGRL
ncbi:hypothetical protein D047_0516A, partial [Vibrio parahaemolyticus VPTS-2010_2]